MTGLARDVRYGIRMLARNPGLSLAAVLAFALGIGLSTAMFSIVYGTLFRGLPFDGSSRLMYVASNTGSLPSVEVYYQDYLVMRERQRSFEDLAGFFEGTVNLSGDGKPERYTGAFMTPNAFDVLRVKPAVGRGILPGEDSPRAGQVVLLSWGVWQARYNGDPGVLGRKVRINGEPGTIVGVMPRGFAFPIAHEIWASLRADPLAERGAEALSVFGRLRQGVSARQAQAELRGIAQALARDFPETNTGVGAVVKPYADEFIGADRGRLLLTLMGACLAVLLLACINVASLIMARASKRTREIAIRSSLGADRRRLIGQLLIESLLLSFLGAVLGLLLAHSGVTAFNAAMVDMRPPFWVRVAIDPAALLFALGATLAAGLISGLVPAFQASRAEVGEVLKDEGRATSLRMGLFTRVVVVLEVGLSCLLLIGAGLMIQNVLRMEKRVDFATAGLFTGRIALFESKYEDQAQRVRFFEALLARLRDDPAVVSAAVITHLPASHTLSLRFALEGTAYPTDEDHPWAHVARISPGLFETFGVEVLKGRGFGTRDTAGGLPVALVNRSFAEKFWPGQDPLGQRIRLDKVGRGEQPWRTVVGVVPDLGMAGLNDDESGPAGFYIPLAQDGPAVAALVARTRGPDPLSIAERVRAHVAAVDGDLPVYRVESMEQLVAKVGFYPNLFARVFVIFGLVALVLASVGIYGVIAFSVEQRTQEIGIRMALGAQRSSVLGLILRQGMLQLLCGLVLGLALAWPAAKLLASFLVGVQPHDLPTFAGVCLLLAGVALLACWFPAQRASRTDPLVAIRYD